MIKKLLRKPYRFVKRLIDLYVADRENPQRFLNGHYYSPIPSLKEIDTDGEKIFRESKILKHINLNEAQQKGLLKKIAGYYPELPFPEKKLDGFRFCYDNPSFPPCDAVFHFGMIRELKPKRWIEVGCGYSSALLLDVNERFFDGKIQCDFIDPYPQLLRSLLKSEDRVLIHEKRLQDVPSDLFKKLESGDVLFVDNSHVMKIGSDVNHILFEILPILNTGVYIHFHDIFYPFEYPKEWVIPATYPKYEYGGISWNEIYAIKAFLAYNTAFEIVMMQTFLTQNQHDFIAQYMPLALRRASGSLWLRKVL
jgi:hypothetical protein